MLRVRNITLPDTTMLKNSGIKFHGRSIPQFFRTTIDEVQGVLVMATHPTRFVCMIPTKHPIYVRNGEIPTTH
jgi:hypothetical protein